FVRSQARELVRPGGEVVDTHGRVLAEHDGTYGFTVGQRKGLGVAIGEPRYVVEVDAVRNRVVVGPGELLSRRGLEADRVSWVAGEPPHEGPFEAAVRVRYRGDDVPAVIEPSGRGTVRVTFRSPQRAIARGQSVVVYRGDDVLGGGRIVSSIR
ncbi:MAG TPA: aminomethyltransferase beta-barrel domain-containing protein, partial [Actinomycetota bacterium]|nr:aminomethyltransferase beta-barrel domain-containing protein [Actinomycetota bacterium]